MARNKQEDLEALDEKLREKMLNFMKDDKLERLTELTPVINYLAKNNVVAEKKKSTVEDEVRERIAAADARRKGKK